MVFDKNSDGIKMIFKYDYNSRMRFSRNISKKKNLKIIIFKDLEVVYNIITLN